MGMKEKVYVEGHVYQLKNLQYIYEQFFGLN